MTPTMTIQLYDLASRYRSHKLSNALMRDNDLFRLSRQLSKRDPRHVVISGLPGSGKSRFIEAFAFRRFLGSSVSALPKIYLLKTDPLVTLLIDGEPISHCVHALEQAVNKLGKAIIIIEDIHLLLGDNQERDELVQRLLTPLLTTTQIQLIMTTLPEVYRRSIQANPFLNRYFNHLALTPLTDEETVSILSHRAAEYQTSSTVLEVGQSTLDDIMRLSNLYGQGRSQPDAALRLLDDALTECLLHGLPELKPSILDNLISEREGVPINATNRHDTDTLLSLESTLNQRIVGQPQVIKSIAGVIQRARLGFRKSTRPQASFMLLGPSGVGKTETAKQLAELLFHNPTSFIRLDMSEFSEAHTSIRLIGSPPGYVGYEEGGQLTNPVAKQPQSLILLDEIEKAHPKVFDLFLQILDDGRLTDSSGRTIDFRHTVIIATSNCGNQEIGQAIAQNKAIDEHSFFTSTLFPVLSRQFRIEFLNRFDAILAFRPLDLSHLIIIAQAELKELEQHLHEREITFTVSANKLTKFIQPHYNPMFGARPVRRIIADRFESPLIHFLLAHPETRNIIITGDEPWLN